MQIPGRRKLCICRECRPNHKYLIYSKLISIFSQDGGFVQALGDGAPKNCPASIPALDGQSSLGSPTANFCPIVDLIGSALIVEEDRSAGGFISCTYKRAGICTYFAVRILSCPTRSINLPKRRLDPSAPVVVRAHGMST